MLGKQVPLELGSFSCRVSVAPALSWARGTRQPQGQRGPFPGLLISGEQSPVLSCRNARSPWPPAGHGAHGPTACEGLGPLREAPGQQLREQPPPLFESAVPGVPQELLLFVSSWRVWKTVPPVPSLQTPRRSGVNTALCCAVQSAPQTSRGLLGLGSGGCCRHCCPRHCCPQVAHRHMATRPLSGPLSGAWPSVASPV